MANGKQVVALAGKSESHLRHMNSQMRRIDLFCKLLGPLAIALLDGVSTILALKMTLAVNVLAVLIEYGLIAATYRSAPALQSSTGGRCDDHAQVEAATEGPKQISKHGVLACRHIVKKIKTYVGHAAFLPSLSLSLLYLTVLSFSSQMVTYLLSVGFTSTMIGIIRAVSVVVEMSATWLAPHIMSQIGPTRAGLWFLSWQSGSLGIAAALFWLEQPSKWAPTSLVVGVVLSRIGLWGFDLSAQMIIQEVCTTTLLGG
jgi:iron-regulated transporter 1